MRVWRREKILISYRGVQLLKHIVFILLGDWWINIGRGKDTCIWCSLTLKRPTTKFREKSFGDAWSLKVYMTLGDKGHVWWSQDLGKKRRDSEHFPLWWGCNMDKRLACFYLLWWLMTCHIQGEVLWWVLFVDDIFLIEETYDGVKRVQVEPQPSICSKFIDVTCEACVEVRLGI